MTRVCTRANIAIGIGANLGDAKTAVQQAIQNLKDHAAITCMAVSNLYRTTPIDASGPDYINAVVTAQTELSPEQSLAVLQSIESAAGRERPYKNAPRTLDLDLLLYDSVQMTSPTLTLPHPRMHLRAFVLVPLAEIAPEMVIPGLGPLRDQLDQVSDQHIVIEP